MGTHLPFSAMASSSSSKLDVLVWGATGFTGSLVAEYLATHYPPNTTHSGLDNRALKWGIGGRNEAKLEALRENLVAINPANAGVEVVVGDALDRASLDAVVSRTRVVASTAGPFAAYGSHLVAACVEAGVSYADITGEASWVKEMINQHGKAAEENDALIVSCCGYDSLPADLGTAFLLSHLEETHPELGSSPDAFLKIIAGVAGSGGVSGGTIASAIGLMETPGALSALSRPFLLNSAEADGDARGSAVLPTRVDDGAWEADKKWVAWDDALGSYSAPFVMAGVNTRVVRRSLELAGKHSSVAYNEAMAFRSKIPAMLTTLVVGLFGMLIYFRVTRWIVAKTLLPAPGQGPSAEKRASSFFRYTLHGVDGEGNVVGRVRVAGGDPGYGETAKFLAESALTLSMYKDRLPHSGGVLTPAAAMGSVLIGRLQAAGIEFEVLSNL